MMAEGGMEGRVGGWRVGWEAGGRAEKSQLQQLHCQGLHTKCHLPGNLHKESFIILSK